MKWLIVLGTLLVVGASAAGPLSDCWATWSRCTKSTDWWTGKAWLSCPHRCVCLGHAGGECEERPTTCTWLWPSGVASRCSCTGTFHGPAKPDYCKHNI